MIRQRMIISFQKKIYNLICLLKIQKHLCYDNDDIEGLYNQSLELILLVENCSHLNQNPSVSQNFIHVIFIWIKNKFMFYINK